MSPPEVPLLEVTCALLWREGRLLVGRRADSGLWELPGGKREPGESLEGCLARELREELGVEVEVGRRLARIRQPDGDRRFELHCFLCRLRRGEPRAREHRELAWLEPARARSLKLCTADARLLADIEARLTPADRAWLAGGGSGPTNRGGP